MNLGDPGLAEVAAGFDGYQPSDLPVSIAQALLAAWITPLSVTADMAPLGPSLLGRVLAQDVISPLDVPAYDNSAMDGYAFDGQLLRDGQATRLHVSGTQFAGDAPQASLDQGVGSCIRIMTGAALPPGFDTVVPQEHCVVTASGLEIPPNQVRPGANRRRQGEDLRAGHPALRAGRRLMPSDLGLLGSLGLTTVAVRPRLKVAVLSTGSELRHAGEPLPPGCIYDSNRHTLSGMLARLGMDILDLGLIRDDPQGLNDRLVRAADEADAIITTGGVGGGDADHTWVAAAGLGDVLAWQLALRPGRPFVAGHLRSTSRQPVPFFGLPGNPVAAMISFYVLVSDALLRLAGANPRPQPSLLARSTQPLNKRPGRTEYQRARLQSSADGTWEATLTGAQGSGVLRSMSEADGLILLSHDQGPVAAGEWVQVLPFTGLL